jgi:hypothetical protein
MKFSVTGVCATRSFRAALAMVPTYSAVTRHVSIVYLVLSTLDRLCKLDMEQAAGHCKWIVYGTDGLGGRGRTRMRPKLHLPVVGHAFPGHCQWCHWHAISGIVRHFGRFNFNVLCHIDLFERS